MIPKPAPGPIPMPTKMPTNVIPVTGPQLQLMRQGSSPLPYMQNSQNIPVKKNAPLTQPSVNVLNQNKNPNVGCNNKPNGGLDSLTENLRNISNMIQKSHAPQPKPVENKENAAWDKKYFI
jgi:hypothetical protein